MLGIQLQRGVLRSRVARRVFTLFVACALVPLAALAFLTFSRVTAQLREQADRHLHREAKASGMELVARLTLLEAELSSMAIWGGGEPDSAWLDGAARFRGVSILTEDGRVVGERGQPIRGLDLTDRDRERLRAGGSLARAVPETPRSCRVLLVVPLRGRHDSVAVAEVAPEFLWPDEDTVADGDVVGWSTAEGDMVHQRAAEARVPDLAGLALDGVASGRFALGEGRERYQGRYWTLFMRHQFDAEWVVAQARPEEEILEPAREFMRNFGLVCATSLLVIVLLSSTQIRRQLDPIEKLQEATRRVAREDFETPVTIASRDEFAELGASFNSMMEKVRDHTAMRRVLVDLGISLSAEREESALLQIVMQGAEEMFSSDGVLLALVDDEGQPIWFGMRQRSGTRLLSREDLGIGGRGAAVRKLVQNADVVRSIPRTSGEFWSLLGPLGVEGVSRDTCGLAIPVRDYGGHSLGALVLLAESSSTEEAFRAEDRELGCLLAAQAGAAFAQARLILGFKALFDGLSQLIATAIDEKSPYTYGHCQRVPIVTMMIADRAAAATDGPLAGFELSPDERYELEIAALLHDCGKVTTPVHVVDKATKLETIHDRIELIETRAEIVRRDRVIAALRAEIGERGGDAETLLAAADMPSLRDDLDFIRRSNKGGEFLSSEDQGRIRRIASRYGYESWGGARCPLVTDEETANLIVSRGTLNSEERQIIQNHIVSTIRMLEMLPYPRNLKRVPLIAGAHHERMDGRGYPNGIRLGELPVQARILALADVFEALTAKDRPYKDGKTLSEVISIMGRMKLEGHLDPDVFDFFIAEQIYMEYAHAHLEPRQIDAFDIETIPGCAGLSRRAAA